MFAIGGDITDYKLYVANGDVKIDSNIFINNNVGIGTNATDKRLEVSGGNALFNNNVGVGIVDNLYKLNVSGGDVKFNNNLFIDSNVGINTINPTSRLTINDTIIYCSNNNSIFDHSVAPLTVNSSIIIPRNERGDNNIPVLHLTRDGNSVDEPGVRASFQLSRHRFKNLINSDDNNTRLDISLANSNYNNCNVITMLSNGKVGIGLSEPLATLHINGDILVEGGLRIPFTKPEELTSNALMYIDNLGNMRTKNTVSIDSTNERIGIGIINPSCSLDVLGSIQNTNNLDVGGNTTINGYTNIVNNVIIGTIENQSVNTSNYRLQVNNSINDIGLAYDKSSCNLYVKNDIIASAFSQLSDVNVKTNISNLEYNDDIMNLRPVSFNWSSNYYNKQKIGYEDVGLIAQEVETHIPGLVFDNVMLDGNSWKTVNYTGLIPYMIKHIQNLNKRIENLEDKINKM